MFLSCLIDKMAIKLSYENGGIEEASSLLTFPFTIKFSCENSGEESSHDHRHARAYQTAFPLQQY